MKLIFIISWIFHSPDTLWLSIISCRCGIILWSYCTIDSFSQHSHLCSVYLSSKASAVFLVCSLWVCFLFILVSRSSYFFSLRLRDAFLTELGRLIKQLYHLSHFWPSNCLFFVNPPFSNSSMLTETAWNLVSFDLVLAVDFSFALKRDFFLCFWSISQFSFCCRCRSRLGAKYLF